MKIASPLTSLPTKPNAGTVSRTPARGSGSVNFVLDPAITPQAEAPRAARPTRISRFPEEAALFAYNRQAQLDASKLSSKIDEYV